MGIKEDYLHGNIRAFQVLLIALIGILLMAACNETEPVETLSTPSQATVIVDSEAATSASVLPVVTTTATESPTEPAQAATETVELPSETPLPTETPIIYIVQENDTLWAIAQQFDTSAEAIQRANNIADGGLIQLGQELLIPTKAASEQEAQPAATEVTVVEGIKNTPQPDGTVTVAVSVSATPTAAAKDERGVLHNYVLCPEEEAPVPDGAQLVGYSAVCRLPIVSYRFGEGDVPVILIAGMHGGYEWNTITLAYEVYDYLLANPGFIAPSLSIYLIPNANPDGLYAVTKQVGRFSEVDVSDNTVPGRFNGNNVDLNRNWDCNWSPVSLWRDNEISGGTEPFSEPENQALRQFIMDIEPATVLFWHSAARGVYAAGCGAVDPLSKAQAQVYGSASGYPVYESFEHYAITGDASDWLSTQDIPSFTVELATHQFMDWDMNLSGLRALFQHLAAGNE